MSNLHVNWTPETSAGCIYACMSTVDLLRIFMCDISCLKTCRELGLLSCADMAQVLLLAECSEHDSFQPARGPTDVTGRDVDDGYQINQITHLVLTLITLC